MAKVWFVRRRGGEWIAPGGAPAYEQPLAGLIFPLDLGTHRRIEEAAIPEPSLPREDPSALQRVFVEVGSDDLKRHEFSGYEEGFYDSPFSPRTVTRRLPQA
jgi:hypothetical protein